VKEPLDELVREARIHHGAEAAGRVDWQAVDAKVFGRIEAEQRQERMRFAGGTRWPALIAAGMAAAAVLALAMGDAHERPGDAAASLAGEAGGRIASIEPGGQVFVDGRLATEGAVLRLGDVLEVKGGSAVVERPGKLTMRVEGGSRAAVTHTDGSLVLALARGAVEAQVVPVPSGEAFAVDVDGSRVAVHGTHLRVARSGDHVTVDLNEGVVAVGNAPRVGSVIGSLVTAPAHAEFGALDVGASLTVSHDPSGVRPPVPLGSSSRVVPSALPPASAARTPVSGVVQSPVLVPVATPRAASVARVGEHAPVPAAVPSEPVSSPVVAGAPAGDPNAEENLGAAVRSCMDPHPQVENVTVVVSTTLHLDLADDGSVRAARFEPPVAPDVNACAASIIYRMRFTHGGTVAIPVSN
jgi:hypothetical protein